MAAATTRKTVFKPFELLRPGDRIVAPYGIVELITLWYQADGRVTLYVRNQPAITQHPSNWIEVVDDGTTEPPATACHSCGKPIHLDPPRFDSPGSCRTCERNLNVSWLKGIAGV